MNNYYINLMIPIMLCHSHIASVTIHEYIKWDSIFWLKIQWFVRPSIDMNNSFKSFVMQMGIYIVEEISKNHKLQGEITIRRALLIKKFTVELIIFSLDTYYIRMDNLTFQLHAFLSLPEHS